MVAPFSKAQLFEKRLAQSNISQQDSLHPVLNSSQFSKTFTKQKKRNLQG